MNIHIAHFGLGSQWISSLFRGSDPGSTSFVCQAHANHKASHHNQSHSRKTHGHRETSDVPRAVGRNEDLAHGNTGCVAQCQRCSYHRGPFKVARYVITQPH